MFVLTLNKNAVKRLGALAVCGALLAGTVYGVSRYSQVQSASALPAGAPASIETTQDIAAFFSGYGLEVDLANTTVDKVKVPKKWDDSFSAFNEVVKADPRLFSLTRRQGGYTVDGLGFDLNGENTVALVVGGNTTYPKYQTSGLFTSTPGNYNRWTCTDEEDHWNSPSEAEPGVWRCLEQQPDGTTVEADVNATRLQAGATYLFLYEKADGSRPDYTGAVAVEPYEQAPVDYTQGLFLVNEDWYGWDNGTVNFLTSDGRWVYRAFRRENPGETLGVTTQYGAIYGGRFFFVSKQASSTADASTGGRLVVADALTLKKVAAFDEIGGDGRAFVGVDEHTAYIGTSSGITRFDLESMSLGEEIAGTGGEGGLYAVA